MLSQVIGMPLTPVTLNLLGRAVWQFLIPEITLACCPSATASERLELRRLFPAYGTGNQKASTCGGAERRRCYSGGFFGCPTHFEAVVKLHFSFMWT